MAVPLPLMTRDEIDGIITAGEEKSGLRTPRLADMMKERYRERKQEA